MTSAIDSPWNYAVSYVELFYDDQKISKASGFFWRSKGRLFLVSNWHVFSGRNPETGHPLDVEHASIPNKIAFSVYRKIKTYADGSTELMPMMVTLPLYNSIDMSIPLWREHHQFRRKVDVACLDITDALPPDILIKSTQELEGDADVSFFVSQDVFIIGYPLGLIDQYPIPVWKRGSIATEPAFLPKNLPKIFLDTASRSGMSGSIVIGRFYLTNYKKRDGSMSNTLSATRDQILGIYSGRLGAHDVKAQLGITWHYNVIDEVTTKGVSPVI